MTFEHCIKATDVDPKSLESIQLPPLEPDGRIPTLSNYGMATFEVLGTSAEFVEYASTCNLPVFDGGGAYGATSIAALEKGATVIANDLKPEFFNFTVRTAIEKKLDLTKLYYITGSVFKDVNFPSNSLGAIHMSRVTHFFHPDELIETFRRAHEWLVPNGRFYILTMSQFHYSEPNFDEVYEERYQKGEKFPGQINNFTEGGPVDQQFKGKAPTYLHAIDPRVLLRLASDAGFIIKKLELAGGKNDNDYTCAVLINRKK